MRRPTSLNRTDLATVLAIFLAIVLAAAEFSLVRATGECVAITKKEAAEGRKTVHFRNACSFPVVAIVKNPDSGRYTVHALVKGQGDSQSGIKAYPSLVGWCKSDDQDCLQEYGVK